jgi:prepilin-type N-terminal cleavage/methylation domain-containing protein
MALKNQTLRKPMSRRHYDNHSILGDRPKPRDQHSKDAGLSLTENLVVLAIILTLASIGLPILWEALQTVRSLLALVAQVTIH